MTRFRSEANLIRAVGVTAWAGTGVGHLFDGYGPSFWFAWTALGVAGLSEIAIHLWRTR